MGFDLDQLDTEDTSEMRVVDAGQPTPWVWVFAGPAHEKTIAQGNRIAREDMDEEKQLRETRANGKKYKVPPSTPEARRIKNTLLVVERLLDWYLVDDDGERSDEPVTMGGKPFPFSEANAQMILSDRKKPSLLVQALEYLGEEKSFTKRSAMNSTTSQGENSNSQDLKTESATATSSKA